MCTTAKAIRGCVEYDQLLYTYSINIKVFFEHDVNFHIASAPDKQNTTYSATVLVRSKPPFKAPHMRLWPKRAAGLRPVSGMHRTQTVD